MPNSIDGVAVSGTCTAILHTHADKCWLYCELSTEFPDVGKFKSGVKITASVLLINYQHQNEPMAVAQPVIFYLTDTTENLTIRFPAKILKSWLNKYGSTGITPNPFQLEFEITTVSVSGKLNPVATLEPGPASETEDPEYPNNYSTPGLYEYRFTAYERNGPGRFTCIGTSRFCEATSHKLQGFSSDPPVATTVVTDYYSIQWTWIGNC